MLAAVSNALIPQIRENPITSGVISGIFCATTSFTVGEIAKRCLNLEIKQRDIVHNAFAMLQGTSTKVRVFFLTRLLIEASLFVPVAEELLFRDKLFSFVNNNFPSASTINFTMMPILFSLLHYEPRQGGTNWIIVPATLFQGVLYTFLRQSSEGLKAPVFAHIANNVTAVFLGSILTYFLYRNGKSNQTPNNPEKPEGVIDVSN